VVDEQTRQIELINAKLGGDIKIAVVPVDQLEFLEKNARFMKNEQFQNLVNNIKRDGQLSSVPFCWLTPEGKYKVLSGNHRSKAAIAAGLTEIPIMYTDRPLSKDEQIAIQLSHNAITGEDDPFILQELYDAIEDLDLKYYAGLDDKVLEQLDKVEINGITEAQLDYASVSFLFLPNELEKMLEVLETAKEEITSETVIARFSEYDRVLEGLEKVKGAYNIHNGATAIMIIMDIFERHLEDLQEGFLDEEGEVRHKSFVPLSSVLGTEFIPSESLAVIKKAVDKMMSKGDITKKNKWQALEYWAAEYLAGE
jgi:hypothetical protein